MNEFSPSCTHPTNTFEWFLIYFLRHWSQGDVLKKFLKLMGLWGCFWVPWLIWISPWLVTAMPFSQLQRALLFTQLKEKGSFFSFSLKEGKNRNAQILGSVLRFPKQKPTWEEKEEGARIHGNRSNHNTTSGTKENPLMKGAVSSSSTTHKTL